VKVVKLEVLNVHTSAKRLQIKQRIYKLKVKYDEFRIKKCSLLLNEEVVGLIENLN
jgi:hypothetical protein